MDAGIMISASHNPVEDNGIKFFSGSGYKLSDDIEKEIETIIENKQFNLLPKPVGKKIGRKIIMDNPWAEYGEFLKSMGVNLAGLKVGLDCANGAVSTIGPKILVDLGADVYPIHHQPTGLNINDNCGSTHMDSLIAHVKEAKLDIGIAFDGDGDRCLVVDEMGTDVDGDEIMAICAQHMKEEGLLEKNTIVATVMSNLGLKKMGEAQGINILETKVGDRYVLEAMLKSGYNFGGEQSGHIIFLDHATSGDGILTALQLLKIMKLKGKSLSQLNSVMQKFPQVMFNARVENDRKDRLSTNEIIVKAIKDIEAKYHNSGRVLIRPSGTEPVVRVMIEGDNVEAITADAKELAALIEQVLL